MAVIKYEIVKNFDNFLTDPKYSAELSSILKEFEDKFLLAESVFIKFQDYINHNPNEPQKDLLSVSEDGKIINLEYKTSSYHLPKGGLSRPSAEDFFDSLRYYMNNTVIRGDIERFEKIDSSGS